MSKNLRLSEIQETLKKTTEKSLKVDDILFKSFSENKTDSTDLDFVKAMTGNFRTTVQSAKAELLAHRISTNRVK